MKFLPALSLALMLSGCAAKQDATQPNYVDVQPGAQTIQERNNELARNAEFEEPEVHKNPEQESTLSRVNNSPEANAAGSLLNAIVDGLNTPIR